MRGAVCGKLLGLDEVKGIDQRRVAPTLKPRDRRLVTKNWKAQQVLTNLKVAGYTPFETEGVIERAAPGVRQPCRHGDHHSARQTGCVQPTLTPPTDRRRTVAMLGLRRLRTWR